MMRLAGGDAVTYMYENAGSAVSQEVIDETRKEYGLDQPFLVQYAKWFAGMQPETWARATYPNEMFMKHL